MPVSPTPTPTPTPTQFTYWDPGGCNCATAKIRVQGCGTISYPGLTVSVYTSSGGTLLYSGTTDSTGTVATGLAAGSYYITITGQSSRYNAYAQTDSLVTTSTNVFTLVVATGYSCLYGAAAGGCLQPAATTLHYTGPAGNLTLTGGGGSYEDAAFTVQFVWTASGGVPKPEIVYLATGTTYYDTSYACPPGLTVSFSDGSTVTE